MKFEVPGEKTAKKRSVNNQPNMKNQNLTDIQNRLSGWQLQSFLKSYKCKVEEGMSLYKKAMIKK